MGFEYPHSDVEFPSWAQECINTWHDIQECGNHRKAAFAESEKKMLSHAHAYISEGMELGDIRYKRTYEEQKVYTFKDYCDKFYYKSYQRALDTILAAQIGWEMLCNGFQQIPTNISQCIALSRTFLKDGFGQPDIVSSWEFVLGYAKTTGKKITAGLINFLVNPPKEEEKVKVKVTKKKWEKFEHKVRESGHNAESVLERLIDNFVNGNADYLEDEEDYLEENEDSSKDPDSAEPESKESSTLVSAGKPFVPKPWQEDLEDLLAEHQNTINNNDTT